LSGEKAQAALLGTLLVIEAVITPETTVLIPFARTKVNAEGSITDVKALAEVQHALEQLLATKAN
ncbi:MAG: hypothetical protein ABI373_07210, partial [Flavobacteriales bacterium]